MTRPLAEPARTARSPRNGPRALTARARLARVALAAALAAILAGCTGAAARPLDGDAAADADPDAERDSGPAPLVECDLEGAPAELAATAEPLAVTGFGAFAVGVVAVSAAAGEGAAARGVIYLATTDGLDLLGRHALDGGATSVAVRLAPGWATLDAAVSIPGGAQMRAFALDFDWSVEAWALTANASHDLCADCAASAGAPLPGPGVAAVVTRDERRATAQLHVAPYDASAAVAAGPAIPADDARVVRGSFGPLVVAARDGALCVVPHHWDGQPAGDERPIALEAPVHRFAAVDGPGGEAWLAVVEETTPRRLVLVGLDGEGRRTARHEVAELRAEPGALALSVDDLVVVVAWIDAAEAAPDRLAVRVAALRRAGRGVALAPVEASGPLARRPAPSLAAGDGGNGSRIVVWAEARAAGSALRGVALRCREP